MSQVPIHARFLSGGGQVLWPLRNYLCRENSVNFSFGLPMAFLGCILIIIFRILITYQGFFKKSPHPRVCLFIFQTEERGKGERQTSIWQRNIDWLLLYVPQPGSDLSPSICSTRNWIATFWCSVRCSNPLSHFCAAITKTQIHLLQRCVEFGLALSLKGCSATLKTSIN